METFDVIIILGGISGLFMVIGAMVLLYKGIISLNYASSNQEAVSLEFKRMIRITSHYPALGLFIIGFAFIITTAYFSSPAFPGNGYRQYEITGKVIVDEPDDLDISIQVPQNWKGIPSTEGNIFASVIPRIDILEIRIEYPGYKVQTIPIKLKENKKQPINIGEIAMREKVSNKAHGEIEDTNVELAPVSEAGKF